MGVAQVLVDPSQTPRNIGINQNEDKLFMVAGCCNGLFKRVGGALNDYQCSCGKTVLKDMDYADRMTARAELTGEVAIELWIEEWCGFAEESVGVRVRVEK